MITTPCQVGDITIGSATPPASASLGAASLRAAAPLVIIAGPCVLEDPDVNLRIGQTVAAICADLGLPYIFKASFDKANRTSLRSPRGPGLVRGLDELARLKDLLRVPVTTDVHEPGQAGSVAKVVDLLQIPAFLCRQTDLLAACAATGRAVNVKKGQFVSPAEMENALAKLAEGGCRNRLVTERGTTFGYQRLVNDFIGMGDLMELGVPVCFDVTHSTQLPGAGKGVTAGRPDRAHLLARCAAAAGVDALFIECHPDPASAGSDAATQQPLSVMRELLASCAAIRASLRA